jgi:hypothetical protein
LNTPAPGTEPTPPAGTTTAPSPGPASVRPRYGEASLADVLPGVLTGLGVPGASDPLGLGGALAGVRTVVVLLVDGLGHRLLPLAAPHAPALAELAADRSARAITTGFPSTTPTSIVSLGTGAAPGAHGLVGFFLNVPGTDRVLNHVRWTDDPDPLRWQPLPTQFRLAEAAGVDTHVVSYPELAGSGLSVASFGSGDYRCADTAQSLAKAVLKLVRRASGPTVIYAYHRDVDKAGHDFGLNSPQWIDAVSRVDTLVADLRAGLPPGAALVVTADHGQINVAADHRFDLDLDPGLRAGVRVVAGEARVRYLHTLDGATEDVLATWRGVLGDAAWVVTRDEAVAAGWFGPVREDHLQRVGDVVAACHQDYVVVATQTEPIRAARMIAYHGSATDAEMMIPLLVARG